MITLNHYTIDLINLIGILLGVLGFFYLTYELFGRKGLTWFIRVITPGLLSALILAMFGALGYTVLVHDATVNQIIQNSMLYALVGGTLGVFNGIFVEWPLASSRPRAFSWKAALLGMVLVFCAGSLFTFIYPIPERQRIQQTMLLASLGAPAVGIWLTPLGALSAGIWRFVNWAPPADLKHIPSFSWKWCGLGAGLAFLLDLMTSVALGRSLFTALIFAAALTPTGALAGGLWQFVLREPPLVEEDLGNAPTEKLSERKEKLPSIPKPPLFSARGCLIGLISAFCFGFMLAFISDLFFLLGPDPWYAALASSLRAALTAATLTAPVGALTGGISRFIFWRANMLKEGQLGGIGAALTLLGFIVQLLPSLLDYLNFPTQ